jgi:hypothetical protein
MCVRKNQLVHFTGRISSWSFTDEHPAPRLSCGSQRLGGFARGKNLFILASGTGS